MTEVTSLSPQKDKIDFKIRAAGRRMENTGSALSAEDTESVILEMRDERARLEEEAAEWRKYCRHLKDTANCPQRKFRKRYRKVTDKKAEAAILQYIREQKSQGGRCVTAEEASFECRIPKGQVCGIFHRLNLSGVLSQKKRQYAHDTNRNPAFDGSASGWGANTYDILLQE